MSSPNEGLETLGYGPKATEMSGLGSVLRVIVVWLRGPCLQGLPETLLSCMATGILEP